MRFVRQATPLLILFGALLTAAPAGAAHGTGEVDSLNMAHLGNSPQDSGLTNSDIAFWQNTAYSGYYGGFRIIDISDRSNPQELINYQCEGSQNDVGVWDTGSRRLLFVSVDGQEPDDDCVAQPAEPGDPPPPPPVSPLNGSGEENFEGIRVFDVTDPTQPQYLKAVFTDCGSHTHTVIPVRREPSGAYVIDSQTPDRVFIYVSSYILTGIDVAGTRRCPDDTSGEGEVVDPTHNKISIVEVPFDAPENADVLKEVALHPSTRPFNPDPQSRGCHDIGAFLELELAAAACQGEGQVWDISDPANPDTMGAQRIFNESINYWHSASFTWDGKYLIFGDEEGGAAITHGCFNLSSQQGVGTGATWFYEREGLSANPSTAPADGRFVQDRQQLTQGGLICTSHNYNAIPVPERYLLAVAYYEAGTSVLDFSDVSNTEEIAYFDAAGGDTNPDGSVNENPDTWSSYWYNGTIFANDINRGVDVFGLVGEPATVTADARVLDHLNPQTQEGSPLPGPPQPAEGACSNVLRGTKGSDRLKGTTGSDRISGKRGRDRIKGAGGPDCLRGGSGRDRIAGGGGADEVRGGRGQDQIKAGAGADLVRVARGGRDRVDCGPGRDKAFVHPRKDRAKANCEKLKRR